MFAGIQLVLTQPVRIGDNVVVEKEFGLVEEIHFTFIVIRTKDLRRLIVPISYFWKSRLRIGQRSVRKRSAMFCYTFVMKLLLRY